jgi:hypothetical protein
MVLCEMVCLSLALNVRAENTEGPRDLALPDLVADGWTHAMRRNVAARKVNAFDCDEFTEGLCSCIHNHH